MRISLVTETYFPQVNGVSRTLDRLVNYLIDRGDTVQVIMPEYPTSEGEPPKTPIADLKTVPAFSLPVYKELYAAFASSSWVLRRIKDFEPDVVHIATEGPLGFSALRAAQWGGWPMVSSYHTNFAQYSAYYNLGFMENLLWRYLVNFHNAGAVTFCPCRSIQASIEEKGIRNVRIWARGVESHRFHPGRRDMRLRRKYGIADDQILLVYAGRLAWEKNLAMLMAAFEQLSDMPNLRLMLVGDGPFRARLEAEAGDRVVFTGYQHSPTLEALYASGDLFIFPSLTDTFGNVMMEAMASGLPVVGFDAAGPRDVVQPGKTGFVVREINPRALARTVRKIVTTPELLKRMSRAARAHAKSQTWDAINGVVRRTYEEVIGRCRLKAA